MRITRRFSKGFFTLIVIFLSVSVVATSYVIVSNSMEIHTILHPIDTEVTVTQANLTNAQRFYYDVNSSVPNLVNNTEIYQYATYLLGLHLVSHIAVTGSFINVTITNGTGNGTGFIGNNTNIPSVVMKQFISAGPNSTWENMNLSIIPNGFYVNIPISGSMDYYIPFLITYNVPNGEPTVKVWIQEDIL